MEAKMHLYALTLHRITAIHVSCYGSFTQEQSHEVVIARGSTLEMYCVTNTDERLRLVSAHSVDMFATICALAANRLYDRRDVLIVTSDSGCVSVLEFVEGKRMWTRLKIATYGKSGIRRTTPGHYLAVSNGCFIVGAIEKQKFVFKLSRTNKDDGTIEITMSSPLEAHKQHTICFSLIALDVGFDAVPTFAALEQEYLLVTDEPLSPPKPKQLVYYECDPGLHTVVRKVVREVDPSSNLLFAVPGGVAVSGRPRGPGGVIVCSENYICWVDSTSRDPVRTAIPRRQDLAPDHTLLMVAGSSVSLRSETIHFLQSEMGDLYKVTLGLDSDHNHVRGLHCRYFDSLPVSNALHIMRIASGALFCACETADHRLYKFTSRGERTSDNDDYIIGQFTVSNHLQEDFLPAFIHRALANFELCDTITNIAPLLDLKVTDTQSGALVGLGGRAKQSSLLTFHRKVPCSVAYRQHLEHQAQRIFSVRYLGEAFDRNIVIAFANASVTYAFSENQELHLVTDSGINDKVRTIAVGTLADGTTVQIQPEVFLHVRRDRRTKSWTAKGGTIKCAALNSRQVVVVINSEFVYFVLHEDTGDIGEIKRTDIRHEIIAVDISPLQEGRQRADTLAVATRSRQLFLFSLGEPSIPQRLAMRLPADPSSVTFCHHNSDAGPSSKPTLNIYVGLEDGTLIRYAIDEMTGTFGAPFRHMCGSTRVRTLPVRISPSEWAVVAVSSVTWLSFYVGCTYYIAPLSHDTIEDVCSWSMSHCPCGLLVINSHAELLLIEMPKFVTKFDPMVVEKLPMLATARKFVRVPDMNFAVIIETDHHGVSDETKERTLEAFQMTPDMVPDERDFGAQKGPRGQWVSYVRTYDLRSRMTPEDGIQELGDNYAAVSVCILTLKENAHFVIVGAVKNLVNNPKSYSSGMLFTLKLAGSQLAVAHRTPIDGIPYSMASFNGKLLVGVNNSLRLYQLGKKQLLIQTEKVDFSTYLVSIQTMRERIYVADANQSVHFLHYKSKKNVLATFADDVAPRWVTAMCVVDYSTVACGDKFGSFFVVRLPPNTSADADDDPGTVNMPKWEWERGVMNGAPQRGEEICNYYVGDTITSISKTRLNSTGPEVLLYSTIGGSIGCFQPLTKSTEVRDVTRLETAIRLRRPIPGDGVVAPKPETVLCPNHTNLLGRSHMQYRSYYFPVRCVVDGDFLETFLLLPRAEQERIADELGRKVEDLRLMLQQYRSKLL